jgi:hypothetical protein
MVIARTGDSSAPVVPKGARVARQKEEQETQQRQAQEAEMPGERARLEYGIDALGTDKSLN